MTKFFSTLLMVLGFVVMSARAENPIDFSTSNNLKAVYDAGFRPWRTTMFSCMVADKTVSVILPGNAQFSLTSEIASFSVLAGDQISSTKLFGEVMPPDEAVAKTREICEALGISTDGLDQAIPSFAERNSRPDFWARDGEKDNISIHVSLVRLDFIDHLGAKVYVILQWKHEGIPPKFPTTPMQPPAGYENESMAPPGIKPGQKGFPAHDMQYYKDLIAKKKAEEANPSTSVVPPQPPPQATPTPQVQPASETGIPFWVYGIIVLILGLIAALWYRSRPKK